MLRAVKIRLYPNKTQEQTLNKVLGCYRFVYNQMLVQKQNAYKTDKTNLKVTDLSKWFHGTLLKDEQYAWLKEQNTKVMKQAIRQMDGAYQKFFKQHNGFPKFKKKKNKQSAKIYSELKGLKRFIIFANTDEINKLVNENPDYFYEILPYAYSFNLTDEWTSKFKNLAIPQPEWYSSYKIFTHKSIDHFINNTMVKIYNVMSNCPKKFRFTRFGHDKHV